VNPTPVIRRERGADIPGIRAVVHAAFGRRVAEADLVDGLRRAGALTLSAVAMIDNRIVGYVAFSPVTIGGTHQALALAPVSVAPDCQRQGIGSSLIRWSLEQCRQLGHGVVLVVGNPAYYSRFGFTSGSRFGIECPFAVPPEAFRVLELSPGASSACRGMVRYRPEFDSF
jgi:putative acetyltransferase